MSVLEALLYSLGREAANGPAPRRFLWPDRSFARELRVRGERHGGAVADLLDGRGGCDRLS